MLEEYIVFGGGHTHPLFCSGWAEDHATKSPDGCAGPDCRGCFKAVSSSTPLRVTNHHRTARTLQQCRKSTEYQRSAARTLDTDHVGLQRTRRASLWWRRDEGLLLLQGLCTCTCTCTCQVETGAQRAGACTASQKGWALRLVNLYGRNCYR